MKETVFISVPLEEFKTVLIDCVNACLKYNTQDITKETQSNNDWLNLNELCDYLPDRPVKATVYGWVHNNIIPHHKGGKKLRFLKSEINEWLKEGKKKTNAEIYSDVSSYLKKKGSKAK